MAHLYTPLNFTLNQNDENENEILTNQSRISTIEQSKCVKRNLSFSETFGMAVCGMYSNTRSGNKNKTNFSIPVINVDSDESSSFNGTIPQSPITRTGLTRVNCSRPLRRDEDSLSDDSDNEFDDSSESLVSSLNKALDNLYPEDGEETETDEKTEPEESEEERLAREQLESEALARQLMAEEAMASYSMSAAYLRDNADNLSEEDRAALQAALDEEMEGDEIEENDEQSLSYDAMLRLGEQLGDVKEERWAMVAKERIQKLPLVKFSFDQNSEADENDCSSKCLVCQFIYEEGENLRVLPCGHRFHAECVDQWLTKKSFCPYCRHSIEE